MAVNTISANQVQQMLARNQFSLIIDLRDYYDYTRGHLPNAINIPTNQVVDRINQIQQYLITSHGWHYPNVAPVFST